MSALDLSILWPAFIAGLLVTAESFCAEKGVEPQDVIEARLAEDMLPFAYQVKAAAVHSLGRSRACAAGCSLPT